MAPREHSCGTIGTSAVAQHDVRADGEHRIRDAVVPRHIDGSGDVRPGIAVPGTTAERRRVPPRGIREHLHLNRPIYVPTSAYGHFGREPDMDLGTFTWEVTDLVPALKAAFGR